MRDHIAPAATTRDEFFATQNGKMRLLAPKHRFPEADDIALKCIRLVSTGESPSGADLLIAGNEVSGGVPLYLVRVNGE